MDSGERKIESCRNDYHQSSERILGDPTSDLPFSCSTKSAKGLGSAIGCKHFMEFLSISFFAGRPSHTSRAPWCLLETMYETDILMLKEEK